MKKCFVAAWRVLCLGLFATLASTAGAGSTAVQGANGDRIKVDGDRSDWAQVPAYPADTVRESGIEANELDWHEVRLAHSARDGMLYVRYAVEQAADFANFPAFYNLFLDTDGKRSTGYLGGAGQFSIGADYLIQGATVFIFRGSEQTMFAWDPVGVGAYDAGGDGRDIELAVPLHLLDKPASFDFLLYADNVLNGHTADYHPDGADRGARGDFFTYDTKAATAATGPRAAGQLKKKLGGMP